MDFENYPVPVHAVEFFRPILIQYLGNEFNAQKATVAINQADESDFIFGEGYDPENDDPMSQVTPMERRGSWPGCYRDGLD